MNITKLRLFLFIISILFFCTVLKFQVGGGGGDDDHVHDAGKRGDENKVSLSTPIDINHNSSLVTENILSIVHDPSKARIQVQMKKNRPCKSPFLIGRLSGKYLSIIQWEEAHRYSWSHNTTTDGTNTRTRLNQGDVINVDNTHVLTGYYRVPTSGKYFLEIIMLQCNSTSVLAPHSNLRDTNSCLEDPKEYQITSIDAHIMVSKPYMDYDNDLGLGYWKLNITTNSSTAEDLNLRGNTSSIGIQKRGGVVEGQIFTRYQPKNCRDAEAEKAAPCSEAMSLERFESFQFQWNTKTEEALKSLPNVVRDHERICVVGMSHTRKFLQHFVFTEAEQYGISNQTATWHKAARLREIDENFVSALFGSNCTKILFSLGQWDGLQGLSLDDWHDQTLNMIALAASRNEYRTVVGGEEEEEVGIFITANHYNPLGDVKLSCSPEDFRSPPIIDKYNSISREICRSTGKCTFVDTNTAVIGAMWDSAPDWCHYELPGKVEVSYILGVIFGLFE